MKSESEEQVTKLAALRARLQDGEKSPLAEDIAFEVFLEELHDQYVRDS
ncbi:MAG: type II toxin-antitoxin system ParD family antitoxin [Candidatus Thiodiazotropha sp.]